MIISAEKLKHLETALMQHRNILIEAESSVFLDFTAHSCVGHANLQFWTLLFATVHLYVNSFVR